MSEDMLGLAGKRVLVTGASGGIGIATSRLLIQLGARVLMTDLKLNDAGRAFLDEVGSLADFVEANLTQDGDVARLDVAGLDGLVALNGIFPIDDWMAEDVWKDTFRRVIDVNVVGTLALLRRAIPAMVERGDGRVVICGSSAGRTGGDPNFVQPHYTVSKAGLHGVVYNLARRFAKSGLRINGVAPGAIDTAMNRGIPRSDATLPLQRQGRPEEMAWPIAFLCSKGASYMSGQVLDVNGGMYMH